MAIDLTPLINAVDVSSIIAAILLIGAALASVAIAWKGIKIVLCSLGGGHGLNFDCTDQTGKSYEDWYRENYGD